MGKAAVVYDQRDLERVDVQLVNIRNACNELRAFSSEKGGLPFIERNLDRIDAPLNLLMSVSEVLDILREG